MDAAIATALRAQLLERRDRLSNSLVRLADTTQVVRLLGEVDAAIERMNTGTYGLCEVCLEDIEEDRLLANRLVHL
jgi:RNA polymerase-binding transcription factor DksA